MAKKKEEFKAHACEFKNEKECEEELDEEGKEEQEEEEEFFDEDEPEEKATQGEE